MKLFIILIISAIIASFVTVIVLYQISVYKAENFSTDNNIYSITYNELLQLVNTHKIRNGISCLYFDDVDHFSTCFEFDFIKYNDHYIIMKNLWEYIQYLCFYIIKEHNIGKTNYKSFKDLVTN